MSRLGHFTLVAAAMLGSVISHGAEIVTTPPSVTLVQNVNEPGLNPYQHIISFNQNATYCYSYACVIEFPVVPAGKRLVITYASAQFALAASGSTLASVALTTSVNDQVQMLLPAPALDGLGRFYISASPVTFYVSAGVHPEMVLGGQFVLDNGNNTAQVSLSGYFVNL